MTPPAQPTPPAQETGALQDWTVRPGTSPIPDWIVETKAKDYIATFRWLNDANKAITAVNSHASLVARCARLEKALGDMLSIHDDGTMECVHKCDYSMVADCQHAARAALQGAK